MGSSHFVTDAFGLKIDMTDAPVGAVLAILGALIIYLTKFRVKM
ncbi:MAG: hypothetical protein ACLQPD_33915 [Desulfomonilaceae bacterium]